MSNPVTISDVVDLIDEMADNFGRLISSAMILTLTIVILALSCGGLLFITMEQESQIHDVQHQLLTFQKHQVQFDQTTLDKLNEKAN